MKKRILSIALVALLLMLTACSASRTLAFGTGNIGGNYFNYGTKLSEYASGSDVGKSISVKKTAGSAANIRLIRENFLDFAIVQSDILTDAYFGTGTFKEAGAYTGYSAVAGLYTETCQIVVRADSDIQSVKDLYGRKVSVGETESGTLQNATQILEVAGMRLSDVKAENLSFTDSAKALHDGEIDAFFCTALVMMQVLEELSADTQIRVVSLEKDLIDRLMTNYSGYTRTVVPAGTYNGQTEDATTVGVKAVLIASNDVAPETVSAVLNLLFDKADALKADCKLDAAVTPEFASGDISVPFHKGTADFYAAKGITVNTDAADAGYIPVAGQDD